MLNTIHYTINVARIIISIFFLIFIFYSIIKSCYTVKNYEIRMIFITILLISYIFEALIEYELRISMFSSIALLIAYLILGIMHINQINKKKKMDKEKSLEEKN